VPVPVALVIKLTDAQQRSSSLGRLAQKQRTTPLGTKRGRTIEGIKALIGTTRADISIGTLIVKDWMAHRTKGHNYALQRVASGLASGPRLYFHGIVGTRQPVGTQSFPFFQEAHELPQGLSICLA